MKKQNVEVIRADAETLEELVKGSALTITGLAEESFGDFLDWIEEHTKMKARRVYVTKGRLANAEWGLTGSNRYLDDLNLVSVKLDDMENYKRIVMPRFQVGGRWLDDIHDNDVMRERR